MALANTRLITALREAADGVESGKIRYRWDDARDCNCGVVAQKILGLSRDDFYVKLECDYNRNSLCGGYWSNSDPFLCSATNLPIDSIVRCLAAAGFREGDFHRLEFLSDPAIRQRAGLTPEDAFSKDVAVIRYFRAWADMLEEELNALDPAVATSEPVRAVEGVPA